MLTKNIVRHQKIVINNGFNDLYHYLSIHMVIDVNIVRNQLIIKLHYIFSDKNRLFNYNTL